MTRVFAARFAVEASNGIAARGRFSWALPGGSVAETFFPALVTTAVSWTQVDFFWGDERAVGPDDPDSNYGLAKRLLLGPLRTDTRRIHRMPGEMSDLEAAASVYEREMTSALGDSPLIDLIVLGVGPEGHVCSLFPGHSLMRESKRRVAAILDSPKPPPRRITFTMVPLQEARMICVAGFGESKAQAIRDALENPDSQTPLALALRRATRALVLIDPAAASLLRR